MTTPTRRSPLAALLSDPTAPGSAQHPASGLSHPADLLKVGVKGAGLTRWAAAHGVVLPAGLYDTLPVGDNGVLVQVGSNELILEAEADAPELATLDRALAAPGPDVMRVEQQTATFELSGPTALSILAQTCGHNLAAAPAGRIVFTRVAGVSCGIIPRHVADETVYRLWVDYTYAPYLWETLTTIRSHLDATS